MSGRNGRKILVTGGAGYIGSHTLVSLAKAGCETLVLDNLCNSSEKALARVEKITGKAVKFIFGDVRDRNLLDKIFRENEIHAAIHFAGLKAVGESVSKPLDYYENNVCGTLSLVKAMAKADCKNIIFSSSATVYGNAKEIPSTEKTPKQNCTNPYGWTKWMTEQLLADLYVSDKAWNVMLLRYFNPIGAHKSGLIGENPNGIPNNLMPYVTQVAAGKLKQLSIFGNDYATEDGTGIRDYIHVTDLADGHVAALEKLNGAGLRIYNLGTGKGTSVLQLLSAFEKVNGIKIPYTVKPRRAGDVAVSLCSPALAEKELGWKAKYGIEDMCRDAWNWQKQNPNGYETDEADTTGGKTSPSSLTRSESRGGQITVGCILPRETNENAKQSAQFQNFAQKFQEIYPAEYTTPKICFTAFEQTEQREQAEKISECSVLFAYINSPDKTAAETQLCRAMSYAKPLLCAADADSFSRAAEIIKAADCGFAFPADDSAAGIGRLRTLCSLIPEERNKMGRQGWNYAGKKKRNLTGKTL